MSTLRAIAPSFTKIDLSDEAKDIKVYGFSARHIADFLASYPELSEVLKEVKLLAAQNKAQGKETNLMDLATLAAERAVGIIGRGGVALAIISALREKTTTAEEYDEAFESADALTLEYQIKIIAAAFSQTMPSVAANFRKSLDTLALSASATSSNTGSAE